MRPLQSKREMFNFESAEIGQQLDPGPVLEATPLRAEADSADTIRWLKPEDQLLLICTRQKFLAAHRQMVAELCSQEKINWKAAYYTANQHGVAPLVYVNLQQCSPQALNMPTEVTNQFKQSLMRNLFFKEKLAQNLAKGLSFLADRSIEAMLIKGGALDILVYDQPYYATAQDIDLVLKLRRSEMDEHSLREFMDFFHQSGLEYDYFAHHDVIMNGVLPVDFEQIWRDATQIEFRGQPLWVMTPEDMLIAVCINSCRKRFFRLKALCDIAETINTFDLNWPEVVRRARAYDCHNIVYTALWVTRMTLGCPVTEEVLDNFEINPIRAKVIRYLSRRISLGAFSSLYSGKNLLGRKVDWSLVLPYATFRWYQVWRRVAFVFSPLGEAL